MEYRGDEGKGGQSESYFKIGKRAFGFGENLRGHP